MEGGHCTWLETINLCVLGCPLPPYIKEQGGGRPALGALKERRNPPPSRSRIHPFLVQLGRQKGKGRRGREGGKRGRRPLLVQFGLPKGGARPALGPLLSLSHKAHVGPLVPPGVPITPRHSDKYPVTPGTHPVSEYSRPIYQYLCLDNFETPRHVHDHIRDSELSLVHQNT